MIDMLNPDKVVDNIIHNKYIGFNGGPMCYRDFKNHLVYLLNTRPDEYVVIAVNKRNRFNISEPTPWYQDAQRYFDSMFGQVNSGIWDVDIYRLNRSNLRRFM